MTDQEWQRHYETTIRPALFPGERRQPLNMRAVRTSRRSLVDCVRGIMKKLVTGGNDR